ncbi:hypothetical protein GCM10023159_00120 [Brevibacterium yomogidense]
MFDCRRLTATLPTTSEPTATSAAAPTRSRLLRYFASIRRRYRRGRVSSDGCSAGWWSRGWWRPGWCCPD